MQPRWMVRILKSPATSEGTLLPRNPRAYARTSIDLVRLLVKSVTEEYSVGKKLVHLLWQNGAIVPEQEMMERKRRTMLKAILCSSWRISPVIMKTSPTSTGGYHPQQSLQSLRKRMLLSGRLFLP